MESAVEQFAAQQRRPQAIGSLPEPSPVSEQYRDATVNWIDASARTAAQCTGFDPTMIRCASKFGLRRCVLRLALTLVVNHFAGEWPTASRAGHDTDSMLPH